MSRPWYDTEDQIKACLSQNSLTFYKDITMQISNKGINLIKSFEELELKVYADAVGIASIGYGTCLNLVSSFKQ